MITTFTQLKNTLFGNRLPTRVRLTRPGRSRYTRLILDRGREGRVLGYHDGSMLVDFGLATVVKLPLVGDNWERVE